MRRLNAQQRQSVDRYLSRSALDALAFARQFVEPPALMVRGRVHGRNLRELSYETRERLAQATRPVRGNRALLDRLPGRILCRRRTPEHQRERIAFSLIFEQRDQSCGLPDRDGKYAGCLRIERSEMTGGNLSIASIDRIDSADARHDARRGWPSRLEEIDETDHVAALRAPLISRALVRPTPPRRCAIASLSVPSKVKPAARKWPPPPKTPGHGLHVEPSVRTQGDADLAFDRLKERRDIDAFLSEQYVDGIFGVFSVGAGLREHFVIHVRVTIAAVVCETHGADDTPKSFVAATRLFAKISRVMRSLSAPSRISSAETSSTSGVVFECMKAPVSVMIAARMQVAICASMATPSSRRIA